ncbi:hypothetical protein BDR07DRAFT_37923 [Suillus spraguei]|nr:hypothetical protein BDR07DRAFT_37923 [Suillus spraguei]
MKASMQPTVQKGNSYHAGESCHRLQENSVLIPTQSPQVHSLQFMSIQQKRGQCPGLASVGVAEIDDGKAATTARTIAEEKRIV